MGRSLGGSSTGAAEYGALGASASRKLLVGIAFPAWPLPTLLVCPTGGRTPYKSRLDRAYRSKIYGRALWTASGQFQFGGTGGLLV